jgi:pyridoxamine 5'-phosphate oxidase
MDLAGMRTQYDSAAPLEPHDLDADPIVQLRAWLEAAIAGGLPSPNAMLLSTVDADGQPHARYVLLRGLDASGLVFFTNYESAKGTELDGRPRAALTFGWLEHHRQVRVTGAASRLPEPESDAYFAARPRPTQIGAWASDQSTVIPDRAALLQRVAATERRFAGEPVPRPPHWGGYLVRPDVVELWQGQVNRLHDRLRYRAAPDGRWIVERLSP